MQKVTKNRAGHSVVFDQLNDDEWVVDCPKSLYTRGGYKEDGTRTFVDFDSGPFIGIGYDLAQICPGCPSRPIKAIEIREGVGYVLILGDGRQTEDQGEG